jgi:ferrous iron transport protein A
MPIMIAPKDTDLVVMRVVGGDKVVKHLRELGIVPNMKIRLLSIEPSGIIIRVGESRLALDRNVAHYIDVEAI